MEARMRKKSCASINVRPSAPSHPSTGARMNQNAATITTEAIDANTMECVARRRARGTSRAPRAGDTSAVTATAMPTPPEMKKNRTLLA